MSIDFDSGALQTQHEEEEEYDQEDYAREQELQQLLTDLPHYMLEDSGDQLSNSLDCNTHETEEQSSEHGNHDGRWNDPLRNDPQNGCEQGNNLYPEQFLCDQQNDHVENHRKNWNGLHNNEDKHLYDAGEDYCGQRGQEDPDDLYLGREGINSPSCYHLHENFRPYTNSHTTEFTNQQSKTLNFPDAAKEHLKVVGGHLPESYKVTYRPYQSDINQNNPVIQEGSRRNEVFEDLQHEFLGNDESSSENIKILQLEVLNKARERQLEELNIKLEKSAQQIRYLDHQLSMVKGEKDDLAVSLCEAQKLYQSGKEQELRLEGQIKVLETQIETLTTSKEQVLKQSKVTEIAMESMKKQLLELQRSDALQQAREQHEAIVSALKQKYEKELLSLEQKLESTKSTLLEQQEFCNNLKVYVKQQERMLEETKCEKTEIINRLTRSLEDCQSQCASMLQAGLTPKAKHLRFQIQHAQASEALNNEVNKAFQEELTKQKEKLGLNGPAMKLGVFLKNAVTNVSNSVASSPVSDNLKEEVLRLRKANETLLQEAEKQTSTIEELKENEEKLRNLNQDLCSQIRKMVQDFDQDKKEAIDRCERTYQQHHEDTKAHFERELLERYAAEKKQLVQTYEEAILELNANIEDLNREMTAVKESYIRVCEENKSLEVTLRQKFEQEQQLKEEKLKKQLLEEKECALSLLRIELEEKHSNAMAAAERQWLAEKEQHIEEAVALAKVRWEKEAKELALVFSAADEKWKKESANTEKPGTGVKELKEKRISHNKESVIKGEDISAAIKAELEKAHAQWNKEKQEEIQQIQEQNEKDYQLFLDDHRKRIQEVITIAVDDLAGQKNELFILKEVEMKLLLEQKQREWKAEEARRLQKELEQQERKTMLELESLLSEIHEELVRGTHNKQSWQDRCFDAQFNSQCKDKLKSCLQKAYITTVYTVLEKYEKEWKEKYEELLSKVNKTHSCLQCGEEETEDVVSPAVYSGGQQAEAQRGLRRQLPLHETGTDKGEKYPERNLGSQKDSCSVHCCQDLKRELETAHKYLQLAVKENESKAEQIQENQKLLEALRAENSEVKMQLKDLETSQRSVSKGDTSKHVTSCDTVKALEELRAQYLKAVGKIKCDMFSYMRESRERAANMIQTEVLRERRETAQKIRDYCLTCLQQLLADSGKHEESEKKIMNVAGMLAMMVKELETALQSSPPSKAVHSGLLVNSSVPPGAECSKRGRMLQTRSSHMESKSSGESSAEKGHAKVVQKRVPRDLRQQLDAAQPESQHMPHETMPSNLQNRNPSKNLAGGSRDALPQFHPNEDGRRDKSDPIVKVDKGLFAASSIAQQNAPPPAFQVRVENTHGPSYTNDHTLSGPTHPVLKSKQERMVLK